MPIFRPPLFCGFGLCCGAFRFAKKISACHAVQIKGIRFAHSVAALRWLSSAHLSSARASRSLRLSVATPALFAVPPFAALRLRPKSSKRAARRRVNQDLNSFVFG